MLRRRWLATCILLAGCGTTDAPDPPVDLTLRLPPREKVADPAPVSPPSLAVSPPPPRAAGDLQATVAPGPVAEGGPHPAIRRWLDSESHPAGPYTVVDIPNWAHGGRQRVDFAGGKSLLFYLSGDRVMTVYDVTPGETRRKIWGSYATY